MERDLLDQLLSAVGEAPSTDDVTIAGADPVFPLRLRVGEAGAAAIAATGLAAARLWQQRTGRPQKVRVDVDAAAAGMRSSRYLQKGTAEPLELPVSRQNNNFFRTKDGRWVYLHREYPHHRARTAALLNSDDDIATLNAATLKWDALDLEDAVHAAGSCAGIIRTRAEWEAHPQGQAVAKLPILEVIKVSNGPPQPLLAGDGPLAGVRVLDLTRVLAGPTCGRTLAEHGADVLRIGAPHLPNTDLHLMDTGHGKRSTVLDLNSQAGADQLRGLIGGADVFSQGYRPGSLAGHGFGLEEVAALRPGIVYVTLSAFSHEGPWRNRRGFDTLVQTVSGISNEYQIDGRPNLLPVSALDYITGYVMAFGVMAALRRRAEQGGTYHVRISLAQIGHWLWGLGRVNADEAAAAPLDISAERVKELSTSSETPFGRLYHLAPIAQLSETPARWTQPAVPLDHDKAEWLAKA